MPVNSFMKRYALLSLLLFFASTAFSQVSLDAGPKVNGIARGATREEIIRKLGKPTREIKKNADECVGGTEMTLRYPGLEFSLWDDSEEPGKFSVGMFEVTSARWDVSGARVGQSSATVKKLFGTKFTAEAKRSDTIWYYEMDEEKGPGNTNFTFRNGKLFSILSMWLMC
jgi:hypothetical protein